MAAILYQICQKTQERLQAVTWDVATGDSLPPIRPTSIVIRKTSRARDGNTLKTNEEAPGILICLGDQSSSPAGGGTNTHDDTIYSILLQILAADQTDQKNLQTLLNWQEQARRVMSATNFNDAISGEEGCLYHGTAVSVNHVDERMWARHGKFWGGVMLQFWSREPRKEPV